MSTEGTAPGPRSDGPESSGRWSAFYRQAAVNRQTTERHAATNRRTVEDDDLRDGLDKLSRLASAHLSLEELLTRVAGYAMQAIPGAEGTGLTLLEENRADTIVATASYVREIDAIQYSIGEGPCITAAREGQTIMSGSLGEDPRWRQFGRRVALLGVHSALSLPLATPEGVVGTMNIYSHHFHVFNDRAAELGEIFSGPAAIALQNAHVLAQARRFAAEVQATLDKRAVVERAVGIIMGRGGGTPVEARKQLGRQQLPEQQLWEVASQVEDEAVRRARSRRVPPSTP